MKPRLCSWIINPDSDKDVFNFKRFRRRTRGINIPRSTWGGIMTRAISTLAWGILCVVLSRPAAAQEAKLELVVQTGHTVPVTSVAMSADGHWALTGAADRAVNLWDVRTGQKLRTFSGHTNVVSSVKFSADGLHVLTGSWDRTAILWDAETGKKLQTFTGHTDLVSSVSLSGDGERVLTGSSDKTAILWDTQTGQKLQTFTGHMRNVSSVALTNDGRRVVTGSWDKTAILWDAQTGQSVQTFAGHTDSVSSVAIANGGGGILTGSRDRTAILWNAKTGQKVHTLVGHTSEVICVALSADGNCALTGSADKTAILWNTKTGEKVQMFSGHPSSVLSATFSGDGQRVLTGSWKVATLWDVQTGEKLQTLVGHTSRVFVVDLSGERLRAVTGYQDSTAVVWDLRSGQKLQELVGHTSELYDVKLSADGRLVLTASNDKTAILWDAQTGQKVQSFTGHTASVSSASLSGDSRRVLTGSSDGTAILWDTRTGEKLQTFAGHTALVTSVALSRDDRRVLTGSWDKTVMLWEADTGKKLHTFVGHPLPVEEVVFSEDGRRALTASMGSSAILWNTETGEKLRTTAWDVIAFGRTGRRVLAGSADNTVILLDAQTGQKLQTFAGDTGGVRSGAISGDGRRVVTGSGDGTTRIWDAQTGQELCSLISLDAGKDWLVVTPEGLFDGSPDATRFISYRIAGTLEMVPLERFQQKYWQPGLLAKVWAGERPVPKVDIAKSLPPAVRFVGGLKSGMEFKSNKVTVEVVGESRSGFPIKAFRLVVDGRPYRGQMGIAQVSQPQLGEQTARWDVELDPGRHTLRVLADTEYVQGASDEIEVVYVGGGMPAVELPSLFVLAVGVSQHSVPSRALDFADRDASELADALQKHSRPLYQQIETKVLVNDQATRRGIFSGLQWLRERMGGRPNAVGVVFFACHGEKDAKDGSLYFLPHDSEEKDFAGSAIEADTLKKQLASISGRLVLILDACHSGEIGAEKTRGADLTDQLLRDLTAEENGLAVLCSALGNQKAQESREHRHGMFTQALLEALSGQGNGELGDSALKPTRIDGGIYLSALNAYVSARVRQMSKGYQNPVNGTPRFLRDFPISKP